MMWQLTLHPHPTTPCSAVHGLTVQVARLAEGGLRLQYTLHGDIAQVRIPAPKPPAFADGLWQHTCFEAFIAVKGDNAYREFNFSPSGQWAAYAFSDYRQPMPWEQPAMPLLEMVVTDNNLLLTATLLPTALPAAAPLQLACTAVIELSDGSKSYWALIHPSAHPDFHRRNGLTHEMWS